MNTKYWNQRWADGRTGWHRDDVNPHLIEYWSRLGVASSSKVLVPLCGQSLDLHWLADQGHEVVGVEASELALQGLPQHQNLSLHCGDFFKFNDPSVDAWYDRAALVALNPDLRVKYIQHLASFLKPGAKGLLVGLEYPEGFREGPPFSVSENEISTLVKGKFKYELIDRVGTEHAEPIYVFDRI